MDSTCGCVITIGLHCVASGYGYVVVKNSVFLSMPCWYVWWKSVLVVYYIEVALVKTSKM